MNSSELIVDNFNERFKPGDWLQITGYDRVNTVARVSAQAEVVDGNPIVALDDLGIIDLSEYDISAQVGALQGRPEDFEDTADLTSPGLLAAEASLSDDEYIPLENDSDDETPPVQFGGGDFGGGGS